METKVYTEKELISYELGSEVRKACIKSGATNYGSADLYVVFDSQKGINLQNSLVHISRRLDSFSCDFHAKLQKWHSENGNFSIDHPKYLIGLFGGKLYK